MIVPAAILKLLKKIAAAAALGRAGWDTKLSRTREKEQEK